MVGDQTYSLVFQNNKEPFEANITRIAVEKEFYTDSVDLDVDEAITELERKLGTTLDDLRRETSCVRIAGEKIVAFIANLLVRTQALRQKVLSETDMSVDYFAKRLAADPGLLSRLTQHEAKKRRMSLSRNQKNVVVIWTAISGAFSLPILSRQQI